MQLIKSAIATFALLSVVYAAAVDDAAAAGDVTKLKRDHDVSVLAGLIETRDPAADGISARACQGSSSCKCNGCTCKKVKQGQYCGMCDAVLTAGGNGALFGTDIFECNPRGECCWYGPSSTCAGSVAQDQKHCPK